MAKIIASKDFTMDGEYYFVGDELDYDKIGKLKLIKLNQKGFINPLTIKEIKELEKGKEE